MNIHEALLTRQPITHPDMIGAFKLMDSDFITHHDRPENFIASKDWHLKYGLIGKAETKWCLNCLSVNDLIRTDWQIVKIVKGE